MLLLGCDKDKTQASGTAFEIKKEYKRGPVVFTLKVSKKKITIADHLRLVLDVCVKEGYEAKLPAFGEKLDQFGIIDYATPPPELVEGNMKRLQRSYALEPFLSGDYKIPPMKVSFWKQGEKKKHAVESEVVVIKVTSILPDKAAALAIKEIAPPVEMPRRGAVWTYAALGLGCVVLLGGGGLLLWWRHRRPTQAVLRRSAHEIAYEELAALIADDLPSIGEIKAFYQRLSGILRHYIENRFGLRAPERTTEEFLEDLGSSDALSPEHKNLLKEFLQHCDLVKFAAHAPGTHEIQSAFDACKRFIAETEVSETAAAA